LFEVSKIKLSTNNKEVIRGAINQPGSKTSQNLDAAHSPGIKLRAIYMRNKRFSIGSPDNSNGTARRNDVLYGDKTKAKH
jgi:hypothetical protein